MNKLSKILILIFTLMFTFIQTSFAGVLYLIEGVKQKEAGSYLEIVYLNRGYNLLKKSPYYGVSMSNTTNFATVILQQSGNDLYYYYESNAGNTINSDMLKFFKSKKTDMKKISETALLTNFETIARNITTTSTKTSVNKYVFDDNQTTSQTTTKNVTSDDTLKGYVGKIAAGTSFGVYLKTALSTANANKGDSVVAVLTNDWIYNNKVIAPQGSLVIGTITKANSATYGKRNGYIQIDFNELQTTSGKTYKIGTEKIDFKVDSDGQIKGVATKLATGAALGALSALLVAALSSGDISYGKSSAIGAGIGAGVGLISVAAEQGVDAEIPAFTEINLTLTQPLSVTFSY